MYKQILIIIGLLFSLFGTYKLYKSIIPRGPLYAKDGSNEAFPNAVLDINVAKIGLSCIFIGIIFQIISIIAVIFTK
jgi:hypothetical protein